MAIDGVSNVNGKDNYTVSGGGQTQRQEETPQVDMSKAKGNTSEEGFAASGLTVTKKDVKAAQDELGIRTSAKTKERVANMRNEYAQKIMAYCGEGCPPTLKAVALSYAQELPMASRGRDIQNFKAACEAKLDAFRSTAQRMGLGEYLLQMEKNNQARFDLGEASADLRQAETDLTIVETGQAVIEGVNAHTDESNATQTAQIKRNTDRTVGGAVKRINRHTSNVGNGVVVRVNAHTDQVGAQVTHDVTQNTSAMLGVDASGYTVKDDKGNRVLANGATISDADSAVGQVKTHVTNETNRGITDINNNTNRVGKDINAHTDKVAKDVQLDRQQNAVLQSMRAGLTDAIGHHERDNTFIGGFGPIIGNTKTTYRDSTIKWLSEKADAVMADSELTFDKKKAALTELRRMVEEEAIISDGDKATFENTYLRETREHKHI